MSQSLKDLENSELIQAYKNYNPALFENIETGQPDIGIKDIEKNIIEPFTQLASSSKNPNGFIDQNNQALALNYVGVPMDQATRMVQNNGISNLTGIDFAHKNFNEAIGTSAKAAFWGYQKGMYESIGYLTGNKKLEENLKIS